MGGLFPFQVVIAPYRLWCLGRSGRRSNGCTGFINSSKTASIEEAERWVMGFGTHATVVRPNGLAVGAPEENGRGVCEEVRRRWRVAGLNRAEGGSLKSEGRRLRREPFEPIVSRLGWWRSCSRALWFHGVLPLSPLWCPAEARHFTSRNNSAFNSASVGRCSL